MRDLTKYKYVLALVALGTTELPVQSAFATNPADMKTWYADSRACSISQILLITDEQNPDDRVALVSFMSERTASSYAKWMQSDNTLTLHDFQGRPDDTFTGTVEGSSLRAVHTWLVKRHALPRNETCTFTLG